MTKNAYDYLTSDDASEPQTDLIRYGVASSSIPSGFGLTAASTLNTLTVAIPDDTSISIDTGTRNFRLDSNLPITSVTATFLGIGGASAEGQGGPSDKVIKLVIVAGNDGDSTTEDIVDISLFFGGHLARDGDWAGIDDGSGDIAGAPFHMRVDGFVDEGTYDGKQQSGEKGIGAEDRSINDVGIPLYPPVAVADLYDCVDVGSTFHGTTVLVNDTDADTLHSSLTAVLVAGPSHGTLTLNSNGSFTYLVNAAWAASAPAGSHPTDSFTYKANDGLNDSNVVTVTLTINRAPVAAGAGLGTIALNGTGTTGLLYSDPDGDALTVTITQGTHGTAVLNPDGTFTYTGTVSGDDSFTYSVADH